MNRIGLSFALVAAALVSVARADDAFYSSTDPNAGVLKLTDAQLSAVIPQEMKKLKVTQLKKGGDAIDVAKLTRVEKIAIVHVLAQKQGVELDTMVEDGGQFTPVEAIWDGDTITITVGTARPQLYGKAATKDEIQKKFGTGEFVDDDARWDNDSLFMVESALATLTTEELQAIAGIPFHRVKAPKGNRRGMAAVYVPERSVVELYDFGIEVDKRLFNGTVDKPVPRSVATLIHECGHALARAGQRGLRNKCVETKKEFDELNAKYTVEQKKYVEDNNTYKKTKDAELGKSLQQRQAELKKLHEAIGEKKKAFEAAANELRSIESKGSLVEQAFDKRLSFKKSATPYGRTSVAESFADCLALHKLDPKALERAAPGAGAFFESPEYAKALKGE